MGVSVTRRLIAASAGACAIVAGLAVPAAAQTDEIQVYNAQIADQGVFNLTIHTNFTPDGIKIPSFPGAVTADKSLNGVPEWAYGVKPWFEAGLYMPLYSVDKTMGFGFDGFKLRALFVVPHAEDRKFFYGTNFEFSVNAARWNTSRVSSEIRPIVGVRLGDVDLIFNPILDTEYDGLRNLDFAPALRIALNMSKVWAVAVEEYDDFGPIHGFLPAGQQVHEVWGVIDRSGKLDLEAGVGAGLTAASDKLTLKLILSFDLNSPKEKTTAPKSF
jgi:hypothetical protein